MKFDLKELKNITVLYVEDEEMIRTQTVAMFENLFKKTHIGTDGSEGLQLFNDNKDEIDIVVSDINMPELSGLEMAEEIHKINTDIPIILTTAYTDEEYLLKSLELNIYKYVTKPLKIKDLTTNMVEAVQKFHTEKKLKKTTQNLANQHKKTKKEISQLQEDIFISKKELTIQNDIINDYVSYITIDQNGIIKNVSNKFCVVYGYKKNEILEQNINLLSENKSIIQKKLLEAIREKKVIDFTNTFITKDNKKIKLFSEIYPLYKTEDELVSGYNIYQDTFIS